MHSLVQSLVQCLVQILVQCLVQSLVQCLVQSLVQSLYDEGAEPAGVEAGGMEDFEIPAFLRKQAD